MPISASRKTHLIFSSDSSASVWEFHRTSAINLRLQASLNAFSSSIPSPPSRSVRDRKVPCPGLLGHRSGGDRIHGGRQGSIGRPTVHNILARCEIEIEDAEPSLRSGYLRFIGCDVIVRTIGRINAPSQCQKKVEWARHVRSYSPYRP
jgi:hypothetical protein